MSRWMMAPFTRYPIFAIQVKARTCPDKKGEAFPKKKKKKKKRQNKKKKKIKNNQ
jgi:hypothetical protein